MVVVPVVQHTGQQVQVSRRWRGEQVPRAQRTAVGNPPAFQEGSGTLQYLGLVDQDASSTGAAWSTAASRVPVPPAMSAIVAVASQSSTGTQASDSTWARWTIA
jgi:hypothetical protein